MPRPAYRYAALRGTFTATLLLLMACSGGQEQAASIPVQRTELALLRAIPEFAADTSLPQRLAVYRRHLRPYAGFYSFFLQADTLLSDTVLALSFAEFGQAGTQRLIDTVLKVYPEGYDLGGPLGQLFAQVQAQYPDFRAPEVYTYVAGFPPQAAYTFDIDQLYMNPRYVGIGLHYFMGPDFGYPSDIPRYLRQHLCAEQIVPRIAFRLTDAFQPRLNPLQLPTLLDWMVFYGLKYYFMDVVLPDTPDSLKLQYTAAQMAWCQANEAAVYRKTLPELYQKTPRLIGRWLNPGPHTPGLPPESADRIGHYLGLKIVRSYVQRNGVRTLKELMQRRDYRQIFEASGYKP